MKKNVIVLATSLAFSLFAAPLFSFASANTDDISSDVQAHYHGWLPETPDQWPLVVNESRTPARTLTRGVDQFTDILQTVGGAQRAQVMNVNLTDPNVRMGVVESHDHLTDPQNEVLSSMAHRTDAVAGVNGDFFEIYGSGRPLGMVMIDGRLEKSPNPGWPWNFGVRQDGTIAIHQETYTGSIADGVATHTITSVNTVNDLNNGGLVRVTPFLGDTSIPDSTIVSGHRDPADPTSLIVDHIDTNVTSLPTLPRGTEDIVGAASSGKWLQDTVHLGDRLTVTEHISPDDNLAQALGGGAYLVQDGTMAVPLKGDGENNINNPVTAVGVTKDGKQAVFTVFDGHAPEDTAEGLTRPQIAKWMMQHGAYNAILFDSGGSSQMVGRLPGQHEVSVLNSPSDGHERPVANGLFLYTTEKAPGPATSAVVNDSKPLTILAGTHVPIVAYATDAAGNPASDDVHLSVEPEGLAKVSTTEITGDRTGHGHLVVQAGKARSVVPLTVVDRLGKVSIDPTAPNLLNGGTQQFKATATTMDGEPVALPADGVSWSVTPADLGTVDDKGFFTASATMSGMATVIAQAGGVQAKATVAIGQISHLIDPMTDASKWGASDAYLNIWPRPVPNPGPHTTSTGSISFSSDIKRQPTDAGSLDLHYKFPAGQHVYHLDAYLNDPASEQIPIVNGQAPTAIGLWVKGNADLAKTSGKPLAPGVVTLNEGEFQVNHQGVNYYPTGITWEGWQFVEAPLPAGLQYPLSVNTINLVVINPASTLEGDVYLSGLQALYSPRPPVKPQYTPIPQNPKWLQFTNGPEQFHPGGTTIAAFDDAHMRANDPNGTGIVVTKEIGTQLLGLAEKIGPVSVQALGDMTDSGTVTNLTYMKSVLDGMGLPYHEMVGNHEITQGADPENGNYTKLFGPTHYAYTQGAARVIVTDNAHGGILSSDPFQVPIGDSGQYQWLAAQLDQNTSKVVVVITHMPAYDPHIVKNSQFADRWEAQMYMALVARYQHAHPDKHVIMMYGHARGFSENLLNPQGQDDPHGIPNFVVADAGTPPYATPDQGGFYNYGLFHILDNGDIEFAVQPVLSAIDIQSASNVLSVGAEEQLTATGTSLTGDDLPPLTVPIADPASHIWTSSKPQVASVDAKTGLVRAHRPGTSTITVTSGGVKATVQLTVSGDGEVTVQRK